METDEKYYSEKISSHSRSKLVLLKPLKNMCIKCICKTAVTTVTVSFRLTVLPNSMSTVEADEGFFFVLFLVFFSFRYLKWSARLFPECPDTLFGAAARERGFLDTGGLIMTQR